MTEPLAQAAGRVGRSRRLAAILAADVVGSSRLIEADEQAALAAIDAVLGGVLASTAADHGGRLIKTTGDGALYEFASPVQAVACAVAVQDAANARAGGEPRADRRVLLRIGINLGDVVVGETGDLFGDGVNVAVRLEAIADPGGVAISAKVHDELRGRLPHRFEDRGPRVLKNIERPVRVFRLVADGAPQPGAAQDVGATASARVAAHPAPPPDKPSVAVLPFTNLSGDPEQDYFADGVVEDITTALARVRSLFVIARNSSFTYKGKAVDVRRVGRELGVRYLLEGSVRKAGARVRLTGQLVETATGHHLWADRFDGALEDVFELQDRMTTRVVVAIEPSLRSAEIARARAKPTASLDAYDLYLRALPLLDAQTRESLDEAQALLRAAVDRDPGYSDALSALADCVGRAVVNGWIADVAGGDEEAYEYARRAVAADPENGQALATAAWGYATLGGRFEAALDCADRALDLQPNSVHVRNHCGAVYNASGEGGRALEQFEAARRLSPVDPRGYIGLNGVATAHFFRRDFEEAVRWARRALAEWPSHNVTRRYLAAALAHLGRVEEAREVVGELLARQPNACLARSRHAKYRQPWMLALYVDGLALAGLPEEPNATEPPRAAAV